MTMLMSASKPHNLEVKTFGLAALNIWIYYPGSVDFEITYEDFNRLVNHYLWGGDAVTFKDALVGTELFAIYQEEDTDPPDATYLWAGLLIKNDEQMCKFEESDWVEAVKYVFTNGNLFKGDARLNLLEEFQGHNFEPKGRLRKQLFDWLMTLQVTSGFEAFLGKPCNTKRLAPGGI